MRTTLVPSLQEVEIEQPEDAALALHPRLVVLEVKGVDAGLRMEAGEVEAALDGAVVAGLQFEIGQAFQGGSDAKVFRRRFLQRLVPAFGSSSTVSVVRASVPRGSCGFLSRLKNEGVVVQQRQGIGHQLVQLGIAELQRGLRIAGRELLPQDVRDVIGSKGAGGKGLLRGRGPRLRDRTAGSTGAVR